MDVTKDIKFSKSAACGFCFGKPTNHNQANMERADRFNHTFVSSFVQELYPKIMQQF